MSKVEEIKKLFSRFSFLARITFAQYLSFCSINSMTDFKNGVSRDNSIWPWNADALILIALLVTKESKIQKTVFSKECISYLNRCLRILDGVSFPKKWASYISELGGHAIFGPLFLQQKHYQEYIYSKLFRYYCIFSYDEKTTEFFKRKTGVDSYLPFSYFALMPRTIKQGLAPKNDLKSFLSYQNVVETLINANPHVTQYLTIPYEEFLKQTKEKCDISDIEEIMFSYKVLNEKPIVTIENKNYLVASHDFGYVCTDGLFTTITFREKDMKDHIGKNAMEDYLYRIAKESGLYSLVPESQRRQRFKYKKNQNDPADLILKTGDSIVMVESKESVHIRKSWINDEQAIESEYRICIEGVRKFVTLYRKFKAGIYNPFGDASDKDKEVFLVYLTLQYFPYHREKIISEVANNDEEKAFLDAHLFICDYAAFEIYLLYRGDLISELKHCERENKVETFGAKGLSLQNKNRIPSFQAFVDQINELAFQELDNVVFGKLGKHLKRPS